MNIPKIANFYWDKSSLSYLHMLTIVSFHRFNPDWEINLFVPKYRYEGITWNTGEQSVQYSGPNYWKYVEELKYIDIVEVDFNNIGFTNNVPEVFKSDYIRWDILSKVGGLWSDFDILYLKPLDELEIPDNIDTVVSHDGYDYVIGLLMAQPNNKFFGKLQQEANNRLDTSHYQSIGSKMMRALHHIDNVDDNFLALKMENFYPTGDAKVANLYYNSHKKIITDNTIGVHWYNGNLLSKHYINNFAAKRRGNSFISNMIREYDDIYNNCIF